MTAMQLELIGEPVSDPALEACHLAEFRARFWTKVDTSGDCWLWTAAVDHGGYGRAWLRRDIAAHRAAWLISGRSLTPGLHLDHLCMTPRCVRVSHLEEVTHIENQHRAMEARTGSRFVSACGHPLVGDNLRIDYRGCRVCMRCLRAIQAAMAQERRDAARALGLSSRAYFATYGHSIHTARRILAARTEVAA